MQKYKVIMKAFFLSLIPAICTYLSQSDNILYWLQRNKYIGENINIDFFSNCMCICSIIFTFACLTIPFILCDIKCKEYEMQRDFFIQYNKEVFEASIRNALEIEHCRFNIRIFVPKYSLLYKFKKSFSKPNKLDFHIKNIRGLAEKDITDNLKFCVEPQRQGLVGKCYSEKNIVYDDNLEQNNEINYRLEPVQIAKTNQLKFAMVCPVFSEKNEIISIVAFDSKDTIKMKNNLEPALRNIVINYTQTLYICAPKLFEPKGGII